MPTFHRLTVYTSDDVTVWFDISTDPAHARPFLYAPEAHAESEVDLVKGSSVIGQVTCRVLDKRTNAADQKTGYITARLANAGGDTALNGRRAHLQETRDGVAWVTIMDGVIGGVSLDENMVTYTLPLRDIRERERKTRAFISAAIRSGNTITQAPVVVPRGILAGYGRRAGLGAAFAPYLIPPITPMSGTFNAARGDVTITNPTGAVPYYPVWQKQREATAGLEPERYRLGGVGLNLSVAPVQQFKQDVPHPNVSVLWRAPGATVWNEVRVRHYDPVITRAATITDPQTKEAQDGHIAHQVAIVPATVPGHTNTLPADGATVEVCVVYIGEPTPSYPLAIEGTTFGGLLKDLYDGKYSGAAPRVRYDAAAVAALNTPLRALIEKPADDLREWTERNIYQPVGAAPALSENGVIAPIRYALPTQGAPLITIDDTNAAPDAAWEHDAGNAVNIVRVEYSRDYGASERTDPFGDGANGIGIRPQPVIVEHRDQTSIALLGEQDLELKPVTLRAVAGWFKLGGILPELVNEVGHQLAEERKRQVIDRFRFGGQHFRVRIRRSVSDTWKVGQWALVQLSQFPDYASGIRGSNRLAQIVSAKTMNGAWRDFRLQDAGPGAVQPLAVPTLGTLSTTTDGAVLIPVTAVPTGADVRIDYAISTTQPAADSGNWTYLHRFTGAGTFQTANQPSGATVWIRARSEQEGRRPSLWVVPGSVTIPVKARVAGVRASVQEDGSAAVEWTANSGAAGVRIRYSIHAEGTPPALGNAFDRDASLGFATIPATVPAGSVLTVEVTPWTGWDGLAAFGAAGDAVTDDARRGDVDAPGVSLDDFRYADSDPTDTRTYNWNPGARVARVTAAHRVVAGDVTDADWAAVRNVTAMLPSGATSYTVPQPRFGQTVIGQIEPRATSMVAGTVRRFTITGVRPSAEQDSIEGETVATLWWKTRYNVGIAAFVIFTKCGTDPEVDRSPTRFPGGTSKVKGGTLGADECELDVTMHPTRLTHYRVEAHIDTGAVVVLCEGAFDRNKLADFVDIRVTDRRATASRQLLQVIGDTDTRSLQIARQTSAQTWDNFQFADGANHTFKVPVPNGERWVMRVRVYPYAQVNIPSTGAQYRERYVNVYGENAPALPVFDSVTITAPSNGSSVYTYTLDPDLDLTGYEVDVYQQPVITSEPAPAAALVRTHTAAAGNLPPTTGGSYTFNPGATYTRNDAGGRAVAMNFHARIRRVSDGAIIAYSDNIAAIWSIQ